MHSSQTRCALSLVHCEGTTYAIPLADLGLAFALDDWADAHHAEYLDIVVPAGTPVLGADTDTNPLVECEVYGARVLIPREALEEVN
jgi:hypothetical protein